MISTNNAAILKFLPLPLAARTAYLILSFCCRVLVLNFSGFDSELSVVLSVLYKSQIITDIFSSVLFLFQSVDMPFSLELTHRG
jgi:hypothetical protein